MQENKPDMDDKNTFIQVLITMQLGSDVSSIIHENVNNEMDCFKMFTNVKVAT